MLIGIVAGETSGDVLGAGLIRALRQHYPQARFAGVGGPRMMAEGFTTITPMERLSVMGFVEPLGRLPELLRLKKNLLALYQRERPAVFIGIDSPGFNLRLEQSLHDINVTTVHYVSPSVWAWGEGRLRKIRQAVDLMLPLFPFESVIYQHHQIPAHCVGHPLADSIAPEQDQDALRRQARALLGLAEAVPQRDSGRAPEAEKGGCICLMPGSRHDEVKRLAPVFLDTALRCLQARPDLNFIIPCANEARRRQVDALLSSRLVNNPAQRSRFHVLDGQSHEAMQAADIVLLASGTATLEAMLLKRPMIVCYKLSALTWMLARRLVRVPHVSLPNLLAGRELVPEYLQHEVAAPALSDKLLAWLGDEAQRQRLVEAFEQIHHSIRLDADRQAAQAITDLIQQKAN